MEHQKAIQVLLDSLPLLLWREGLPKDIKFIRDRVRCAVYSKGFATAANLQLITVLECLSAFQGGHMGLTEMRERLQAVRSKNALGAESKAYKPKCLKEVKMVVLKLEAESKALYDARLQWEALIASEPDTPPSSPSSDEVNIPVEFVLEIETPPPTPDTIQCPETFPDTPGPEPVVRKYSREDLLSIFDATDYNGSRRLLENLKCAVLRLSLPITRNL